MTEKAVDIYSVFNVADSDMSFRDLVEKGYDDEDEGNRREYVPSNRGPIAVYSAYEGLVGESERLRYVGDVQVFASLLGACMMRGHPTLKKIVDLRKRFFSGCGERDRPKMGGLHGYAGFSFVGQQGYIKSHIAMLKWVKGWVYSNKHYLAMTTSDLTNILLVLGLSRAEISSKYLQKEIKKEAENFEDYLAMLSESFR